jgi:shikimate 5-dehydrogenase
LGVAGARRPVPPGSWDVLVNATPVGTYPNVRDSAFPETVLDGQLVYDLVYNPPETALVRQARRAGCRAIGGLDMLVAQARLQQQRWCGRVPAVETLRAAALWKLSTFASTP